MNTDQLLPIDPQFSYNWAVWVDNKIAGYVRSESEFGAFKLAKEKIAKNHHFFVERIYLGNHIPVEQNFCFSAGYLEK